MAGESVTRVRSAAAALGLAIEIHEMPMSTRTAEEAAQACGCDVAQIVKSLIFCGEETDTLKLLLVSGRNRVDTKQAAGAVGEKLLRADVRRVRAETGFAIGGVAPFGHLAPIPTWIDETLLAFDRIWAAAGAPHAVFSVAPGLLAERIGAIPTRLA